MKNKQHTRRIKLGVPATVNRAAMPTLIAAELSDYHAFNSARIIGRIHDRVRLKWQDGHTAWFDSDAVIPLY